MFAEQVTTQETHAAGGVVLNAAGNVLVVNQRGNSWSLPKGHIEAGEDRLAAARREIEEESGITELTLIKELGSYQRYRIALDGGNDLSELKNIHMFLFTTTQEELKPIDPENPEAKWVEPSKVAELLTHPKDQEFFQSIIPVIEAMN